MKNLLAAALIAALAGHAFAQDAAPPTVDPVEAGYRALAETTIADALVDPDSAKFKWNAKSSVALSQYRPGMFGRPINGNLVMICGRVNAKNRMGGYIGYEWFAVILKDGAVVAKGIDAVDEYDLTPNSDTCAKAGL